MNTQSMRRQFLLLSTAISLGAVTLCALFLLEGRSPSDIMAVHWNQHGQADGYGSASQMFWFLSAMALAPMLAALAVAALPRSQRALLPGSIALTTSLGTLVVCLGWSLAKLNHGVTRWQDAASMPAPHVALLIILPFVLGALGAVTARQLWPTPSRNDPLAPSLTLEPGERVFWLGRVEAGVWLCIGLPLAATLAWITAELVGVLWALLLLTAFGVLADAFSLLRVAVDSKGLTVRYGHLGVVRQLIPLASIEGARALDILPMDHGGWGYRGSLALMGSAAVVVRKGEAIELTLKEGRRFMVTVNDASTGAALLNGLARRALHPSDLSFD